MAGAVSVGGGAVIASITGRLLDETASGRTLLGVILTPAVLALAAACLAAMLDRRERVAA